MMTLTEALPWKRLVSRAVSRTSRVLTTGEPGLIMASADLALHEKVARQAAMHRATWPTGACSSLQAAAP